jgi:hypothetical protein
MIILSKVSSFLMRRVVLVRNVAVFSVRCRCLWLPCCILFCKKCLVGTRATGCITQKLRLTVLHVWWLLRLDLYTANPYVEHPLRSFCDRRSVGQCVLVSAHDQLITVWRFRSSYCEVPSLTRGRVCNLLVQFADQAPHNSCPHLLNNIKNISSYLAGNTSCLG